MGFDLKESFTRLRTNKNDTKTVGWSHQLQQFPVVLRRYTPKKVNGWNLKMMGSQRESPFQGADFQVKHHQEDVANEAPGLYNNGAGS